jgi:diketogulonate reductase-like aldo/keto reductase
MAFSATACPLVSANGAEIPALGLGTWQLTGTHCTDAVAAALDIGYRHIDTAAAYDNEAAVGRGIAASSVPRGDIFVTTKVWKTQIGTGALQKSAEASLERLGLASVDLLLIHWPNRDIPLSESIAALCDAQRCGLAQHIGVSNFPTALLAQAIALAKAEGTRLVANQCEFHPWLDQAKVIEACRSNGLAFTSYSPLGRGRLADDPVLTKIAGEIGRSVSQILLRWNIQHPGVAAVPKAGSPAHLKENFEIFDFDLSPAQMQAISALAKPDGRMVSLSGAPDWD